MRNTVGCTASSFTRQPSNGTTMLRDSLFLVLFFVFLLIWLVSWLAFHVAGGLIHLLVVIAVISLILHFVRGSRSA